LNNEQTVFLDLGDNAYDIRIGSGLLSQTDSVRRYIRGNQAFIISNDTVAGHYLSAIQAQLEGLKTDVYLMQDGEQYKTLATLETIIGSLLEAGHNRTTTIIALGGGVVGDTAGFVAAAYQRGVPFIQVPTTLLSQVDSSVGGKTAVNHELGKNMIGAFHQPRGVIIDTETLATLPRRELSAGLAEVIKHGVLADAGYFSQVEADIEKLRSLDSSSMTTAIKGSCEIKAAVVAEDEKEAGKRALLNFGHTFGHAIETGMGYGRWLHGEAVGAGMVMAAELSLKLDRCSGGDVARIRSVVEKAGLPIHRPAELSIETMLQLMAKDKKATDAGMRFVLLDGGIGKTELVDDVPVQLVKEAISAC
jgi:3-dehydroquinate synthase